MDLAVNCVDLAKEAGSILGGGGGGKPEFAQAGGQMGGDLKKAIEVIMEKLPKLLWFFMYNLKCHLDKEFKSLIYQTIFIH